MFKLINIIAASGLALIVAACETAPVVVEDLSSPDGAPKRELLVLPLAGLSPTVGGALGEKMAWAMREAGYPARPATLSNDISPMLTGWIEEASDGGDIIWLNINWSLYNAGGALVGDFRQETAVSRKGWARLSPETLAVIVAQAVPAVHEIAEVEIYPDGLPEVKSVPEEPSVIELTPPEQETIVVSGAGLSRIDPGGNESADPQLSVTAEPTFAPDYEPEAITREEYPQGFSAGDTVSSEAVTPLPETNVGNTGATEGVSQAESGQMTDDVGKLTPETAALVTTQPDLTISETITAGREAGVGEGLMELAPEPQQVDIAPGMQSQAETVAQGSGAPPVTSAVPATQQQSVPAVASVAPQPTLSDGNAALGFVRPVFLVRHITGAPGDGNLSLRTAMLKSLREADAMVTDNPTQASYVIQGTVQIAAPFAGRQRTRIVWLITTITGEEVGTAIQENDIPSGSLDGKWGPVAQVITNAAIPGVAQLFDTGLDAGSAQGNLAQPDLPHMIEGTEP